MYVKIVPIQKNYIIDKIVLFYREITTIIRNKTSPYDTDYNYIGKGREILITNVPCRKKKRWENENWMHTEIQTPLKELCRRLINPERRYGKLTNKSWTRELH